MAPISHFLLARSRSHYQSSSSSSSGGGIGGGVVAAIIALMIIVFICVYISEYNKAKRIRDQTGQPIKKSACFKKAFLIALTLGFVSLICAECCGLNGDTNGDAGNAGGAPAPQMDQSGGGFVQQPMPSYQPQMDWTPVNSAAADPIQG